MTDDVTRSRRELAAIQFVVLVVVVVVLPLVARALFFDGGALPGGAGSAQVVLGVVVGVLGSAFYAREMAIALVHPESSLWRLVRLPRPVRRAVYRRQDLGEFGELRHAVPVWLEQRRRLCRVAASLLVWACGLFLIIGAGTGGVAEFVTWVVAVVVVMLVLAMPLMVCALWLRRAERGYTPGGGRSSGPAGHRDGGGAAGVAR